MGHISFVGKLDAVALSAGAPPLTPGFTLDLMAKHSLDFWLTSEDLPDPDNRVTLDRDGNIELSYTPNNEEGHKRLIATLEHAMQQQSCPEHGHALPSGAVLAQPLRGSTHSARGRGASERHRPLRPRSADVCARPDCARHTSSTTSTSSMAASFRRAAQ